jgi:hypothetical protein
MDETVKCLVDSGLIGAGCESSRRNIHWSIRCVHLKEEEKINNLENKYDCMHVTKSSNEMWVGPLYESHIYPVLYKYKSSYATYNNKLFQVLNWFYRSSTVCRASWLFPVQYTLYVFFHELLYLEKCDTYVVLVNEDRLADNITAFIDIKFIRGHITSWHQPYFLCCIRNTNTVKPLT